MSGKTNRSARAPVAGVPNPLEIDHASGHKKSKRNQPRLDRSSDSQLEKQIPSSSSSKHKGDNVSRTTSSDDDVDGDVSNADAAEPDEESDEDDNGDAFAPSGRAIEEHGDQTGRINGDDSDRRLAVDGKQLNDYTPPEGHVEVAETSIALRDSDDDYYNGVDLISNSEEDEPNIEKLEEANILESEEANDLNIPPAYLEASDEWEGFEIEDGLFLEDVPFFDEQYGRSDSHILDAEIELFRSTSILDGFPSPHQPSPSPRRVRFKEPISELSNDSDMDSDDGDINILFSPAATPVVPSSGNVNLRGPSLGYEDDDGSTVGSSSGYESGLHNSVFNCKANFASFQPTMAILLMRKMSRLLQPNDRSHFFVGHRCRRSDSRRQHRPFQKQKVLSNLLDRLPNFAAAHAWVLGSSILPNHVRSSTALVRP